MNLDEAYDEIEVQESRLRGPALIAALERRVRDFSPGEEGRAVFLGVLGDHLEMAGDHDRAREAYVEALTDGGPTALHPLAGTLAVELGAGNTEAAGIALAELTRLVRSGGLSRGDCEAIGETLEHHERAREALRWFSIPLRDVDPDDIEDLPLVAVNGRFRVRRALGLPPDRYDEATEQVRAFHLGRLLGE